MNKIETANQLRAEIIRLKTVASEQEQQIKNDVKGIREDLKPQNILWRTLASITGINMNKGDFFKEGIAYGFSVLIQRLILKTEKNMEHRAYKVVDTIFDKLNCYLKKFANYESKRQERKEHQADF